MQIILTVVIVACFRLVVVFVDVVFALVIKGTFVDFKWREHNSVRECARLIAAVRSGGDGSQRQPGGGCFGWLARCCGRRSKERGAEDKLERGSGVESAAFRKEQMRSDRAQREARREDLAREMKSLRASEDSTALDPRDVASAENGTSPHRSVSNVQTLLIGRQALKALVGYVFLSWLLHTWGANMDIFVAFSAVGALAVAFSLREVATNVVGGCLIMVRRSFAVGEWIKAGDHEGVVKELNVQSTVLVRLHDLATVEVPNAMFLRVAVRNVSRQQTLRHEFVMPLSVTTGMDRVRRFMNTLSERLESNPKGECKNVWVTLHADPCDAASGHSPGRRVWCRFDYPYGPASPENLSDPAPLEVGGVRCRALRAWHSFLVARDDAMCVAFATADELGIGVGAHSGEVVTLGTPDHATSVPYERSDVALLAVDAGRLMGGGGLTADYGYPPRVGAPNTPPPSKPEPPPHVEHVASTGPRRGARLSAGSGREATSLRSQFQATKKGAEVPAVAMSVEPGTVEVTMIQPMSPMSPGSEGGRDTASSLTPAGNGS